MPRRAYNHELYDGLVRGFREAPGNYSHAARVAGCERRAAKRAWEHGWSNLPWARPIREVLAEERTTALALCADREKTREHALEVERDAAREQAVLALAEEEEIMRLGRETVLHALATAAELAPAMEKLTQSIRARVLDGEDIPPAEAMQLLNRQATLIGKVVRSAEQLIKLDRLDRGAPTEIVHMQPTNEELSEEQARHLLELGAQLLAEMEANDGIG